MDRKRKDAQAKAKNAAENALNLGAFVDHFTKVFGEQFTITKRNWSASRMHVTFDAEFRNKAYTTILSFSLYIDYSPMVMDINSNEWSASIISEILYNRKKVKLSQAHYNSIKDINALKNPELLFPAAKLKKQTAKAGEKPLKKADVLLTFKKELGATVDDGGAAGIWATVPIGEFKVQLFRTTMAGRYGSSIGRTSAWQVGSIRQAGKSGKVGPAFIKGIVYEDIKQMNAFFNGMRALQMRPPDIGGTSADILAAHLSNLFADIQTNYPLE